MCTLLGHLSWDSPRWPPSDSAGLYDNPAWLILYAGFPYLGPGSLGASLSLSQALSLRCPGSHNRQYLLPSARQSPVHGGVSQVTPLSSPHSSVWKLCTLFPAEKRFCLFFSLRDSESVAPELPPVQWGPGSSVFHLWNWLRLTTSRPHSRGLLTSGSPVSARAHPL